MTDALVFVAVFIVAGWLAVRPERRLTDKEFVDLWRGWRKP